MATKIPQLKPVQQHIFIEFAEAEGGDPQALLDSLVDHFRAGPDYEKYCHRIGRAERSLDEGKGIPHAQVMQEMKDRLAAKMSLNRIKEDEIQILEVRHYEQSYP